MGFLRSLFTGQSDPVLSFATEAGSGVVDATGTNTPDAALVDVPDEMLGLAPASHAPALRYVGRVERRMAMQVPAVKRCHDLIAGSLGTLPIDQYDRAGVRVDNPLFEQPERDTPRSVTMARTYGDLHHEGIAWWRVTERRWDGYPLHVRRLDPRSVNVHITGRVYYNRQGHTQGMALEWIEDRDLIRFDSPNDPLLVAGARAIRTALYLDQAASADGIPPVEFFTAADGVDPYTDPEDVKGFLKAWREARDQGRTGYVPAALKYNAAGWDAEKLQLIEQRQHAVVEIARVAGVDPEELGVSTTSRTYANTFDRRKAFLDFTLGGYRAAMEDRLSMGDVTPQGHRARVRLDDFLRSAPKDRYEAYALGLQVGAITKPEIRALEDRPALDDDTEGDVVDAEVVEPTPPTNQPPALPPAEETA